MKILIKISSLLLLGAFLFLISCEEDVLKEEPPGAPSIDDFYKNDAQIQTALNGLYEDLWDPPFKDNMNQMFGDQPTDIIRKNSYQSLTYRDIWTWDRSTRELSDIWNNCYSTVNKANYLLANLTEEKLNREGVTISQDVAQQVEAEARFMRAFYYYYLVKMFGGVPLHKEPTTSVEGVYKERSSQADCYAFIEQDLKEAETLFGQSLNVSNFQINRATVASAQALLARVYANQNKWSQAKDYAQKTLAHDYVELMDDYSLLWHPDHETHGEFIFATNHVVGGSTSNLPNHQAFIVPVYGFTSEQFGTIDFAINEDSKAHMFFVSKEFYNSTPETYRKKHTMRDWMPYYIKEGVYYEDTVNFPPEFGPCMVKRHVLMPDNLNRYVEVDEKLIRASEIYLILAEAENELNGVTQTACDAINAVRGRARGDNIQGTQTPQSVLPDINPGDVTPDQFRDTVITEFARELIAEGKFRMVLRRHNMFTTGKWTDTEAAGNREDYKALYPIPIDEMDRNENLEQNPGYTKGGSS